MGMNGSTMSDPDEDVFQKLSEARDLYENYLAIASTAELAVLRDLAMNAASKSNAIETAHVPQALTISFSSSS